jgi:nitroreductase
VTVTLDRPVTSDDEEYGSVAVASRSAQTSVPLHPLLAERWSPRAWSDEPVSTDQTRALFEAARWAASAMNGQPWRFVAGHRGDSTWTALHDALMPGNQPWAERAPLLVLAVAQTADGEGAPRPTAPYELGLAVSQLTVQAHAEGLHVHQMGGFSHEAVEQAFGLPASVTPYVVLAIGRYGDPETLPESYRERELAPRTRLGLDELVFAGHWGHPANLS